MSQMSSEPNDAASESAPLQYPTRQIPLRFIDVGKRLRRLKAAKVIHIADSLAAQGQLQPIIVTPAEDGRYALLAGNYRRAAAEELDWETIRAEVREGLSAHESSLIEIDENLKRNDLTPAERARHTHERKKIFEHIHPETKPTKKGGPGRGKQTRRQVGDESLGVHNSAERFTKDSADKTLQSERSIQRAARRGEIKRIEEIEGTCLDTGSELDAILQLQQLDPAKADELIDRAVAGEPVSAKAAIAEIKPPRKIKTRAPRQDDSIALRQAEADLKLCQAEVGRLRGKLWNQRAGDGVLGPMAVINTLDAIFAKAQVEKLWGDVSDELVKKLIQALAEAVSAANAIRCYLTAKPNTDTVH